MITIDNKLINTVSSQAIASIRKRKNLNFHKDYSDNLQRLLNAMEPDTYVHPHKHETPNKREVFIILRGSIAVIIYDNTGTITNITILNHNNGIYGVEIPPSTWHSLVSLQTNSVLYEVKDGPYDVNTDKIFATWAPNENTKEATEYLNRLKHVISKCKNKKFNHL